MGKINVSDVSNYESYDDSKTEWLKFPDNGAVARVQFLYSSIDELDLYACHKVTVGIDDTGKPKERYVSCKREYDEPIDNCPLCAAGINVEPVMVLCAYDHKDGKVKLWQRGKTFRRKLESYFNRYPDISKMVFEIERDGARGDMKTQYQLFPMPDVKPIDVSQIEKPNLLGTFILEKTVEEMNEFVNTGKFPLPKNEDSQPVRRQATEPTNNVVPRSRRGAV